MGGRSSRKLSGLNPYSTFPRIPLQAVQRHHVYLVFIGATTVRLRAQIGVVAGRSHREKTQKYRLAALSHSVLVIFLWVIPMSCADNWGMDSVKPSGSRQVIERPRIIAYDFIRLSAEMDEAVLSASRRRTTLKNI